MINRILMVFTAFALAFAPVGAGAQAGNDESASGVCSPDDPLARKEVRAVFTAPELADVRDRTGLSGADPSSVTLLEGPEHARTCAQLQRRIPQAFRIHGPAAPWVATYFRSGDRFLITVISNPDSDREADLLASGQTIILDSDFQVLDSIFN